MHEEYEYAGFRYIVYRNSIGVPENMVPVEGQHPAAGRDKHRRAARECLIQDEAENKRREMSK